MPVHKNAAKRKQPYPSPAMVRHYDIFYTGVLVDHTQERINRFEADLRAAGFVQPKKRLSRKGLRRRRHKIARRAAYFATEAGKLQTVCVIAEALLGR
jgi:hypothetical protein